MNILTIISGVDPELVDGGGAFHVGDLLIIIKILMAKSVNVNMIDLYSFYYIIVV